MKIITVTMVKLTWYIFISISCILINVFIHVSIQLSIKNVDVLSSKLLFQICKMSQLSKQNMASRKEKKWYFEGAVPMQKALISVLWWWYPTQVAHVVTFPWYTCYVYERSVTLFSDMGLKHGCGEIWKYWNKYKAQCVFAILCLTQNRQKKIQNWENLKL